MTMHYARFISICCTLLVALTCLAPGAMARDVRLTSTLSAVPPDAHMMLAVKDGAALRRTVPGRFIEDAIATFSGDAEEGGAWMNVMRTLGLEGDDAFDRVLGQSFVLVLRRAEDGSFSWAMRSEVSTETFRLLRHALAPSPREVVGGRPIFAVEDGRFKMSIERSREGATLTLAPDGSDALFNDLLRARTPDDQGLLGRAVFPGTVDRLDQADALCYFDLSALSGDTDNDKPTWVGLAASVRGNDIGMTALLHADELAGPADIPFRPWPARWFNELEPGAALVMFDRTNNELLDLLLGSPAEGRRGLLPWELPAEVSVLASHRAACVVRPGKGGGLEAALAIETDDVRALANAVDEAMPGLLACDQRVFTGLPVSAIRTCDVNTITPLLGHNGVAQLAWNYRVAGDCNEHQETGWWAIGLGPSTVSALGRALSLEPLLPEDQQFPLIGKGVLRPAMLIRAASDAGLRLGAEGALLERIGELRWDEVFVGTDSGIGAITLSLIEPTPPAIAGEGIEPTATTRPASTGSARRDAR